MTAKDLQTVVRILPKLQTSELRMVESLLRQMCGDSEEKSQADTRVELEEFYSVVERWHKVRYLDMPPPLNVLRVRSAKTYEELAKANVWFRKWAWASLGDRPKKNTRIALLFICLDLLAVYMERAKVAISLPVIARNLYKSPALIELEFPGYISSNLLYLVVSKGDRKIV